MSTPQESASVIALLRTLSYAKVKFLRYLTLDVGGNVRCKVIPVDHLKKMPHKLLKGVAIVKASIGAMPSYADMILPDAGLTAAGTLMLRPDLATLRILPYAPESALVLGSLYSGDDNVGAQDTTATSTLGCDLCCRSLLQRIVRDIQNQHNLIVTVGIELEFVLCTSSGGYPVDSSNFADTTTLNRQQAFVTAVYDALQEQDIVVELLHAESASGQLELVLEYCDDAVTMADSVVLARQTITAVAHLHGLKAMFLPKFSNSEAGNGCHIHLSLYNAHHSHQNKFAKALFERGAGDESVTADLHASTDRPSILSLTGQSFLEGILVHLPAIMAVSMPTNNSFRRVGQGCWTGSRAVWAVDDKEAPLRVILAAADRPCPAASTAIRSVDNTRVEFKLCDSTANIYLALSAILLAGREGMDQQLKLRAPMDDRGCSLPTTSMESLNMLASNELFNRIIPKQLMTSHLAIRRAEASHSANRTLDEESHEALRN